MILKFQNVIILEYNYYFSLVVVMMLYVVMVRLKYIFFKPQFGMVHLDAILKDPGSDLHPDLDAQLHFFLFLSVCKTS